jgi:hypothetical protein
VKDDPPFRKAAIERIVVPSRSAGEFASEAANDLEATIGKLEAWMKRPFAASSRPCAALGVLREIARTGQFTVAQRGDAGGIRAMQLALDLDAIGDALPAGVVTDLRRDLETVASGPLMPQPDALGSLQAQSQLVVRAAYFRAGVEPGQPMHSGKGGKKKPDILIANGASIYGVEVKRPTLMKNVLPRAVDAAEQLRNAGLDGGIVIDITDALEAQTPDAADAAVLSSAELVMDAFFTDGSGWKPGYGHIWMITIMARPMWQTMIKNQNDTEVMAWNTSAGVSLGTTAGSLNTIRGTWMRNRLADGLNKIGFTSAEVR